MGILRLGGLVSGMDTETIIAQLMQIEQQPIAAVKKQQAAVEKQKATWQEVLSKLKSLQTAIDNLKAGEAGFSSGKATSSDDTVVKATAGVGATPGVYSVTVNNLAYAHSVMSDPKASTGQLNITGEFTMSMQISDTETRTVTVTLDGTENIGQIQSKIQNAKDASNNKLPISVSVLQIDDTNSRLIITANYTGQDSEITFTETSGTPLADLGIPTTMPPAPGGNTLQVAKDANFDIAGLTGLTRSSNTVSDVLPGVTLELLKEGGTATITVARDTDKAVSAVQAYVDKYNELVNYLAEQSAYDVNARKGGPLVGDSLARRLQTLLRYNTLDPVAGVPSGFNQADLVGLSGNEFDEESVNSLRELTLDAGKLREKIEENPHAVADLFDAIAQRLTTKLEKYIEYDGILDRKDKQFQSQIREFRNRIDELEYRMEKREENLRRQFGALELALQRLRAQQNQFLSRFGNLLG